jgi:prepilin-type N-terminal cleavage/methylation domain-containing protein
MQKFTSDCYMKSSRGFTLIELLIVIAIIAILAVVVFVALNPVQRFMDARNSRRWSDVNSILTAVHEYIVDNDGALPTGLSTSMSFTQLGTCASGGATLCSGAAASCVDLSTPLAAYLKSIPLDPQDGVAATTGYAVTVDGNNIITISACSAEDSETIEVSR